MRFLSICSGIESASVAWKPLGWDAVAFAEVEPFPCSVLAHHYPTVPNWGDVTKWESWPDESIDLLVGGTPCQSFSNAGKRAGMDDPRGQLALSFSAIAGKYRPRWVVWENVPGVLSSGRGRDFGSFLGSLAKLGYGLAYRVLDAQWFGLAQRRKRVFVVGCLGGWQSAAAVLFEPQSLLGNSPPSREAGEKITRDVAPCLDRSYASKQGASKQDLNHGCGHLIPEVKPQWWDGGQVSQTLDAVLQKGQAMPEKNRFPAVLVPECAHTLRAKYDASEDGTGRGTPLIAFNACQDPICGEISEPIGAKDRGHGIANKMMVRRLTPTECERLQGFPDCYNGAVTGEVAATMGTPGSSVNASGPTVIAFKPGQSAKARTIGAQEGVACTLEAGGGGNNKQAVVTKLQVRRLTPRECERLQGFPDDYTLVPHRNKPAADGPRYKALGNSMAVPVMAWIGKRIQRMEDLGLCN